jgi:hypothetical protein
MNNRQNKRQKTPSKYTAFRCPVDVLERAKAKAASQRRSLSNYMVVLLDENTRDMPAPRAKKNKSERRLSLIVPTNSV